jgi:hypothetical protein
MDLGTCDECAKWDGAEFPIDYPEDYTGVQAPNPRCAGGYGRCRCVWIYITSKRVRAARAGERRDRNPFGGHHDTIRPPRGTSARVDELVSSISLTNDPLVAADGTLWSHAATLGTRYKGEEFCIDRACVENFVKVFTSGYPQKIPVDYEHGSTTAIRKCGSCACRARCRRPATCSSCAACSRRRLHRRSEGRGREARAAKPAARSTTRGTSGSGCAGSRQRARSRRSRPANTPSSRSPSTTTSRTTRRRRAGPGSLGRRAPQLAVSRRHASRGRFTRHGPFPGGSGFT